MAEPKNYFLNKGGEELTSEEVAELLKVNVTAYDMYLVRSNLHALRTKTDLGFKNTLVCLEDIKSSLEVEFKNGSVKKSKIGDVILEHHGDIKDIKRNIDELSNKKQDKGFIKTTVTNFNWWADNLLKIILLIAIILAWVGYSRLNDIVQNLPSKVIEKSESHENYNNKLQ